MARVRQARHIIEDSGGPGYINRLMIGTAVTGLVRVEWVQGRYSQVIPMNWSAVHMDQIIHSDTLMPLRWQTADAQNIIVQRAIDMDFEWLLLIEHDVLLPPDAFVRFNIHMRDEKVPIVSGLYFSRSVPSEPLVFRGRGNSVYTKWKVGDKVWCDGVPTGCLLVHMGIMREMWKDAPEYVLQQVDGGRIVVRRVFDSPRKVWFQDDQVFAQLGTSDLDWCTRVIEGDYLAKAGWTEYQRKKYPLLCDTRIFCKHIDMDGRQYPDYAFLLKYLKHV